MLCFCVSLLGHLVSVLCCFSSFCSCCASFCPLSDVQTRNVCQFVQRLCHEHTWKLSDEFLSVLLKLRFPFCFRKCANDANWDRNQRKTKTVNQLFLFLLSLIIFNLSAYETTVINLHKDSILILMLIIRNTEKTCFPLSGVCPSKTDLSLNIKSTIHLWIMCRGCKVLSQPLIRSNGCTCFYNCSVLEDPSCHSKEWFHSEKL